MYVQLVGILQANRQSCEVMRSIPIWQWSWEICTVPDIMHAVDIHMWTAVLHCSMCISICDATEILINGTSIYNCIGAASLYACILMIISKHLYNNFSNYRCVLACNSPALLAWLIEYISGLVRQPAHAAKYPNISIGYIP